MTDAELTPAEIAMAVMESEAMMWLMVGANHQEAHLELLREYWDQYRSAGGKTWGRL